MDTIVNDVPTPWARGINSSIRVMDERLPGLNLPCTHSLLIVRGMLASLDHPALLRPRVRALGAKEQSLGLPCTRSMFK